MKDVLLIIGVSVCLVCACFVDIFPVGWILILASVVLVLRRFAVGKKGRDSLPPENKDEEN